MGKVWKFGDNLNTDEIIPGRYNITIDPQELAAHVFCEIKPEFTQGTQSGDVVVGGQNFGCGSSREHAPIAIKGAGIRCVIAASYARIFFRNAINIGLPILECPQAAAEIREGDEVQVNLSSGVITDITTGRSYQAQPLPDFVLKIAEAGGIVAFLQEHDIDELMTAAGGAV
ncbi:3-isopropylmalate dehydratase small subunit [Pelolinea submarina]|uniref:3-isopropylmalate dehydratase small subunit n=1 Tax=Pelolinea submarina TaxID=913107 RepID=A0A347ZU40_9CHLR|nr:3-isopropylmalate dehydratase small subunit [Pelolinea submarina]REG10595.1 3-isopropylmalate/(R)-2-methylmalate dehydratase small subunit [Pelolinea submarina]BBB48821.1 3-isopropylmalate/(R)-2-methylmalate dehydratase small subunit [Pelolinea submarina]